VGDLIAAAKAPYSILVISKKNIQRIKMKKKLGLECLREGK